jgi:hypothetical protein
MNDEEYKRDVENYIMGFVFVIKKKSNVHFKCHFSFYCIIGATNFHSKHRNIALFTNLI